MYVFHTSSKIVNTIYTIMYNIHHWKFKAYSTVSKGGSHPKNSGSSKHPYLVTAILAELDSPDNLLVDKVGAHRVLCRVVPGGANLLAEEQPPGGISLLCPYLLGVLLTL